MPNLNIFTLYILLPNTSRHRSRVRPLYPISRSFHPPRSNMSSVRHIRSLERKFQIAAGLPVLPIPRSTHLRKLLQLMDDLDCTQRDIHAEIVRLAAQADAEGRDSELYAICLTMRDSAYQRLSEIETRIAAQKAKITALDAAKPKAPKGHIESSVAAWGRIQKLVEKTRKRKAPVVKEARKEMRKEE